MANQNQTNNLVYGQVTNKLNIPQTNLLVQVYDKDMRSEELLGEGQTDKSGKYKIFWPQNQLKDRERKTADISLKVYSANKKYLLYTSGIDAVCFNVSEREEINIVIESPVKAEEAEYDYILREVKYSAKDVSITDLQETEKNRDITFLAKEIEIKSEKIEHLVIAHRLNAISKIDPAFFYALLRKDTLLKNDFIGSFHARINAGLNSEIKTLLYDAALADAKIIQRDTASAVKEMLVPENVLRECKRNIELLQAYRKEAENYYKNENPKRVLNIISRFVLENKVSELGRIFQENKNDMNAFLKKITDASFFNNESAGNDARVSVLLSELLNFNEEIFSQVKKSKNIKKPEDIKKLGALNKAEWKELLAKSAGKSLNKKLINLQASALARKMEKEFPSVAFAAQLSREKKSILKNHDAIKKFFITNDEFDLQKSNIDLFFKKKKLASKVNDAARNELKSMQRIFKLAPHYSKTKALLAKNIHSAQSIVSLGETRFVKEIAPSAGITRKEAKDIFQKAERTNTGAMLILGELQDTIRTMDVPALQMKTLSKKLETVSKDFPNLKTLFNLTDTCSCEPCRSVYSPAAYLVEILQFLDKRSVTNLPANTTGHLAKDVLFTRRPDLGDIDLSCENANTPVPYIDLVCELLEEAIAPDTGVAFTGALSDGINPLLGKISNALLTALIAANFPVTDQAQIFETETTSGLSAALPHYLRDKKAVCKIINTGGNNYIVKRLRQTLSSPEELAAAPEYVNSGAYNELRNKAYAFALPFDLNHTEAKAYFFRFDVERGILMDDFKIGGVPPDEAIAAEKLGLTDSERILIVAPDSVNQQLYWNTSTPSPKDEMKVVATFLTKTGLTYEQLNLLLSLKFIDPNNNLFIKHNELTCDTTTKEIANLDNNALDRIHRFLRLQKKTGWKFEVLDEIISQTNLGNGQLNNACLAIASDLVKLSEEAGLKLEDLIGFYGEIPEPLYNKIFLNKAKNGFIDEGLFIEKVNGSQLLSAYKTSLSVCLQISEQSIDKLLPILPDGDLTLSNLSVLYAASKLTKKLKLKVDDFILLIELTGIDIQNLPRETLEFIEAVVASKLLSLKPEDVKFMLRHEAANLADREIKNDTIKQSLEKLQIEFQKAFFANRSPFNNNLTADEQKEAVQNLLSKLTGIGEEEVKTFIKFIGRDWTSPADAKTFVNDKLSNLFDTAAIINSITVLAAAPGPDIETERAGLVKSFLDAVSDYQFKTDKQKALLQIISTAFKMDIDLAGIVLQNAKLKQPAPGTSFVSELLLTDSLVDKININPVPPIITNMAFPDQYRALRLLHKLFPLIASFKLDNAGISWYLNNNASMGWFELDSIPYESAQIPIAYQKFISFAEMLSMARELTPVPNPADAENPVTFEKTAEMLSPSSTATRAQFIEAFSLLTGFNKDNAEAIDAHLFPVFNLSNYREFKTWKIIEACNEELRKLGSTVAQVIEFIKPVLTGNDTHLLRTALKARYDEDTWLSTLKEITDIIRPQKRDALIAYLLSVNPEMKDENDLYDYFLVDVKMQSCMPSSRIVQAHSTIQLFAQRSLMGLEPEAAADLDNDKNWKQWKWMKNYRVWEANRKIFLYPENWIEPELRDNKSYLFKELENELLQNELNEFTAEEALIKYLEKLDNIAFLEVTATWYQSDIKTMHVFARTKGGDPAIYYYRRFEQERSWTPWEKVELDITSEHLLAFVRNNRLCLAWLAFSEEADPNPASTVPSSTAGTTVSNDKPKRKLKIQLAISEFADKKWQPKKISKQGILTPSYYTSEDLPKISFNLFYFEQAAQVWIFSTGYYYGNESHELNGIFNIAGCKGYPELLFQGNSFFPDFLPDFKDSVLNTQRYRELNIDAVNDLSARNGISFFQYFEILKKTPGNFRITYPLQITLIDLVALLFQYLVMHLLGNNQVSAVGRDRRLKIPFGTLLPYFMEDSNHAYVIVPGFYKTERDPNTDELLYVKRTGSNALQLIEDIFALFNKYMALYKADPGQDLNALLQTLIADNEYQRIAAELKVYGSLTYGEQFKNMYHPLVCPLKKTLYKSGIPELMKRETQLQSTSFNFNSNYQPAPVVPLQYPVEDIDFSSEGSYSGYNWELFFHIPLLLAARLTKNQRFEEAMEWFHYMFNPTGALPGASPQKYWVTKPFYLTHSADYINQRIDTLLYKIANPSTLEIAELEFAIDEWRNKPFNPHVVARFRPVAYQKALLMKYIDNLAEWGDYLFRQDTMESIAQATQMYILADKLLGPKPRNIPPVIKAPYETYNQIEGKLDAFGNALIDLENILPDLATLPEGGAELPPPPLTLSMLYFCIPQNDNMLAYWDRIADRLFKIRNCRNIDGVERSLALFAPPIDPGLLVRAAASGLDISSILAGINAPAPFYRFNILSQKASELAQEVRGLGMSLLQVIEKKDGEAVALLRSELEIKVLNAVRDIKLLQISEAKEQIEILKKTKTVTEERNKYYASIQKIISKEQLNLDKLSEAKDWQLAANITYALGAVLALVPDFALGVSGFGGSPHGAAKFGGSLLAHSTDAIGKGLSIFSSLASYEASRASILGGYDRRFDDWKLQERLAKKEMAQIDKQITAAEIRKDISEADLKNHDLLIENSKKTDEFMRSKFTNKELYDWMLGRISSVYFRAYQLAHDSAKKAERSYKHELGNDDIFIQYGYWDSMKKGLQTADHLYHDIKRMEAAYLDKNKREYELTKHVSLAMLDPLALVRLKASGVCDFEIPEALYDMDHPGQYFRRIKSISISLPCVAGPYTSVSAKLSLVSNKYRKNTNPGAQYGEDIGNDGRFTYNIGAIQSIAASNSQNDSGMFELNFRDERYLPFEGSGAISTWRLELPKEVRQFDYNSISDVILHVKYTAREGGSSLRSLAETALKDLLSNIKQQLSQTGLHISINMKHDLPNEWLLLKKNGLIDLAIDKSRLPYFSQTLSLAVENVMFIAGVKNNPASYSINIDGAPLNLSRVDELKLCKGLNNTIGLDTSFEVTIVPAQLAKLEDMMLVVKYSF